MALTEYEVVQPEYLEKYGYFNSIYDRYTPEQVQEIVSPESLHNVLQVLNSGKGMRVRFEYIGEEDEIFEMTSFISQLRNSINTDVLFRVSWVYNNDDVENGVVGFDLILKPAE